MMGCTHSHNPIKRCNYFQIQNLHMQLFNYEFLGWDVCTLVIQSRGVFIFINKVFTSGLWKQMVFHDMAIKPLLLSCFCLDNVIIAGPRTKLLLASFIRSFPHFGVGYILVFILLVIGFIEIQRVS